MGIFGSFFTTLLKTDPTMREYLRVKESLDEHNKSAAEWSEEERRWAEDAAKWLDFNKDNVKSE